MFFLTPIGYILSGPIIQFFGRRQALIFACIPFSMEWLLLYQATNSNILLVGLGLIGITSGLVHSPIIIYVAEISKPNLRSSLLVICPLTMSFGVFMESLISHYVEWRTVILINLGAPLIGFAVLLFIPESPHWLASMTFISSWLLTIIKKHMSNCNLLTSYKFYLISYITTESYG